ncbi:peroxiredoxin [Streptomyces sp. BK022]|uniref:redoxin domain-containing protein n=1 Tax=Streptomyces sp. BK022 TaxID=2512123 RepID=UPI0010D39018|nr:redoxin domain-containing protein [Streptomyces sp. BK022]RZU44594.1 peroxiredoxin [Streptomyces sp. BK022]
MQRTVMTSEGPLPVPSPEHEWTVLFFVTEPGIGDRVPELGGCTTGLCSARDASARFARAGARVLGASAHAPGHLAEFAAGRALGYPLIGDEDLLLGRALGVPEVRAEGRALFERAGVVLDRTGAVRALVHPVPDPGRHAELVLTELERLASGA